MSPERANRTAERARMELLDGLPVVERRLDVAGISTPILEGGDGPPVVFLHGIGSFGHSMGGGVAARFALEHSERLRRIVLVDASSLGAFRPAIGVVFALIRYGVRPSAASRERFLRQILADPVRNPVGLGRPVECARGLRSRAGGGQEGERRQRSARPQDREPSDPFRPT